MAETGNSTSDRMCRVSVNPERSSALWWDFARARFDAPAALRPMLDFFGEGELSVTEAEAIAIREWAVAVPDWDDAQPPIVIEIPNRRAKKL